MRFDCWFLRLSTQLQQLEMVLSWLLLLPLVEQTVAGKWTSGEGMKKWMKAKRHFCWICVTVTFYSPFDAQIIVAFIHTIPEQQSPKYRQPFAPSILLSLFLYTDTTKRLTLTTVLLYLYYSFCIFTANTATTM